MTDNTESELEQELIEAALNWRSARLYRVAMQGSPHGMQAEERFLDAELELMHTTSRVVAFRAQAPLGDLIDRSSLGTPEAKAIREEADPEIVKQTLRRADELDADAAWEECCCKKEVAYFDPLCRLNFKAGFMKARGH